MKLKEIQQDALGKVDTAKMNREEEKMTVGTAKPPEFMR